MAVLVDEYQRSPPNARRRRSKATIHGIPSPQSASPADLIQGKQPNSHRAAATRHPSSDAQPIDPVSPLSEAGPSNYASSSSVRGQTAASGRHKVKVAVIGSGLTGLSAAFLLAEESKNASSDVEYEVHVFERAPAVGLDSHSVSHTLAERDDKGQKRSVRVDVPMRSINSGYYPNLMQLYQRLGIPLRRSDFSYSFARQDGSDSTGAPSPTLIYEGASGLKGFALPSVLRNRSQDLDHGQSYATMVFGSLTGLHQRLSATRLYLSHVFYFIIIYLHLIVLALYHHYTGHTRDPEHSLASQTVESFFHDLERSWSRRGSKRPGPHQTFLDDLLVPLFSAMMTVQAASVLRAPIAEVLDYIALTLGRSHYVVDIGVVEVENRMVDPLEAKHIHLHCTVTGLKVVAKGQACPKATIEVLEGAQARSYEGFDHVILATQATQSAASVNSLLENFRRSTTSDDAATSADLAHLEALTRQLSCFTYEDSEVITHLDSSLLPANERDWRDLNLISPPRPHDPESSDEVSPAPDGKIISNGRPCLSENTHTMASHIIHRFGPGTSHSCSTTEPTDGLNSPRGGTDSLHRGDALIQTTNPLRHLRPRKDKIVSGSTFERAALSLSSRSGQQGLFEWRRRTPHRESGIMPWSPGWGKDHWELQLGDLQGRRPSGQLPGIWLCGSWSPGIPLLEGCVTSAQLVVDALVASEGMSRL